MLTVGFFRRWLTLTSFGWLVKQTVEREFITFALKMPEGYVLIAVYLFIYLFICIHKTQKVLNRIA